jgi:hypothetical protein
MPAEWTTPIQMGMMRLHKKAFIFITKHTPKKGRKTHEEEEWTVEEDMS